MPVYTQSKLKGMTKAELLVIASEVGAVDASGGDTNAVLISKIIAAGGTV